MARVLVTGGAGFLGSAIVGALAAQGDEVIAFDLVVGEGLRRLAEAFPSVSVHVGEVTEWPRIAALLQSAHPQAIVHCAAVVGVAASVDAPFRTFQVNVEGSLNLMEAMRLFGVRRMVHISSEETYGPFLAPKAAEDHPQRPLMPYGISKRRSSTWGEATPLSMASSASTSARAGSMAPACPARGFPRQSSRPRSRAGRCTCPPERISRWITRT